jgi:1,4-dihydroxy-6-naphthoate synthase
VRLRLGISPCPNDTFAFHAIMHRAVDLRGLEFDIELLDVQALNEGLAAGRYDVAKASFAAALQLAGTHGVLRAGSALGFGVGPLLVAARPDTELAATSTVLCPGPDTTATLLFRCLHPDCPRITHRVFSEIAPALQAGEADTGVLIHEGRLTYQRDGLTLLEDLGASFERVTGAPVPLGGILARLDLGDDVAVCANAVIRDSIAYGWAHRAETLPTIREHAQELDEAVIWPYVELYVTDHTSDLGDDGECALGALRELGESAGIAPPGVPLRLLGVSPG